VFGILALLYAHAYRSPASADLTAVDRLDTRAKSTATSASWRSAVLSILVALVSAFVAPRLAGIAGYAYFGTGLSEWAIARHGRRLRKRLDATQPSLP
jgi:hypothetical protein